MTKAMRRITHGFYLQNNRLVIALLNRKVHLV